MELRSCIYKSKVMHCRMLPKKYVFNYNIFMFYLDLDEIDSLAKNNLLISRNRSNIFSFQDNDYFKEKPGNTIKEKVLNYLTSQGIDLQGGKIMLHVKYKIN